MCVHCRTGKKLNIMKMKNPFLSFLELRECKEKNQTETECNALHGSSIELTVING